MEQCPNPNGSQRACVVFYIQYTDLRLFSQQLSVRQVDSMYNRSTQRMTGQLCLCQCYLSLCNSHAKLVPYRQAVAICRYTSVIFVPFYYKSCYTRLSQWMTFGCEGLWLVPLAGTEMSSHVLLWEEVSTIMLWNVWVWMSLHPMHLINIGMRKLPAYLQSVTEYIAAG